MEPKPSDAAEANLNADQESQEKEEVENWQDRTGDLSFIEDVMAITERKINDLRALPASPQQAERLLLLQRFYEDLVNRWKVEWETSGY